LRQSPVRELMGVGGNRRAAVYMAKLSDSTDSHAYKFLGRRSTNELCQSWQAINRRTGEPCFVKIANSDSQLDSSLQATVLARSYSCQRVLRHHGIVTARALSHESGRLLVEYPFLDPEVWRPLTPANLGRHFSEIFPRICLAVDYVHMLGLVHCDLKLDNFLLDTSTQSPAVCLIDLDFLCREHEKPDATVFGTPDHIAPEILHNERVYQQSDTYSLGVSLRAGLDAAAEAGLGPVEELRRLTDMMTRLEPLSRPRILISGLHEVGLIDDSRLAELEKRLMLQLLATRFRVTDRRSLTEPRRMRAFFFDTNRLLGLDRDLIDTIARAYACSRRDTLRAVVGLLEGSAVQRHGDYWEVQIDDARLWNSLAVMETIARGSAPIEFDESSAGRTGLGAVMAGVRRERDQGRTLRGYLHLSRVVNSAEFDPASTPGAAEALEVAGDLAFALGRMTEATSYYTARAGLLPDGDPAQQDALYQLARVYLYAAHPDEAEQILQSLLVAATASGDIVREVRVLRLQTYLRSGYRKDLDIESVAEATVERARTVLEPQELILSLYSLAVVLLSRSRLTEAGVALREGFDLARRHRLLGQSLKTLLLLSQVAWEMGDYRDGIRYARLVDRLSQRTGMADMDQYVAYYLISIYARLGETEKADYWSSRLQSSRPISSGGEQLMIVYAAIGYMKLQRSDVRGASEAFSRGLEIPSDRVGARSRAKIFFNLVEAALWQGDAEKCESYQDCARQLSKPEDEAFLSEVDLMAALNRYFNRGEAEALGELPSLLRRLMDSSDTYLALLCGFHLIMQADGGVRGDVLKALAPIEDRYRNNRAPLMRAMALLASDDTAAALTGEPGLRTLKDIFRIFLDGGQKFLAIVVGRKIAGLYFEQQRDRLGRKYIMQVRRLAESLGNQRVLRQADEQLEKLIDSAESHRRLIQSIHGVSQVLRNVHDYDLSLRRLVEFAVNETGAERGALLLKSRQTDELYLESYFNCDDDSLGDIRDISSSVPLTTTKDLEPLVIENAVTDDRTSGYKSVIHHNILSVICIPIVQDDVVLGVFYLDHHTIPALFEKDDITYVFAIANFMAVMLGNLRRYRNVNVINRELMADLNRLGERDTFVTQDPVILEMLRPLAEIARSDSPVLILGESGTGKDILARKVHALSRRADGPLIQINCAAGTEEMIESDLFGVRKGAATGVAERDGKFAAADGGTLFFDEIGDMPPTTQAKVLLAVETRRFEKVGSNRPIHTDVRLIYATNRDINAMVKKGSFRGDLLYRINTFTLEIPPLRERPGDIPLLIEHFLQTFCGQRPAPRLSTIALEALVAYSWPGNARELRNLIERFCITRPGGDIMPGDLPPAIRECCGRGTYGRSVAESVERDRMRQALENNDGNQSAVARELNMPLSTFRRRARKYGL